MKPTCLFTGEVLNENTKLEHAIPESLNGKIALKKVSSTAFNEFGDCDLALRKTNVLEPTRGFFDSVVGADRHAASGGVAPGQHRRAAGRANVGGGQVVGET